MKQNAKVVGTNGRYARIKVDRTSMCDGCHKEGCSDGCAMYKMFGAKTAFEADAVNLVSASVGDLVVVEASDGTVNLNAFFVFIMPIVIAVGVYFASFFLKNEAYRIIAAFASFMIYFAVLAAAEKIRKNKTPRLSITEIVSGANE